MTHPLPASALPQTTAGPRGARPRVLLSVAVLAAGVAFGTAAPAAEAGGFGFKKMRKSIEKRVKTVRDEVRQGADKVADEAGDAARKVTRSRPVQKAKEAVVDTGEAIAGVARKGARAVEHGVRSASRRIGFGYRTTRCAVSKTAASGASSVAAVTDPRGVAKPSPSPVCPPPACTAPC